MTPHERTSLSANAPDIFNCQRQTDVSKEGDVKHELP